MKLISFITLILLVSCVDQKAKNEAVNNIEKHLQNLDTVSAEKSLTSLQEIAGTNDSDYKNLKDKVNLAIKRQKELEEQKKIEREIAQENERKSDNAKNLTKYWNESCLTENLNKLFKETFREQSDKKCLFSLYSEVDEHTPEMIMAFGIQPNVSFFYRHCKHYESGKYLVACNENKIVSIQIKGSSQDFYNEIVNKYGKPEKTNKLKQGATMDSVLALHFLNNESAIFSAITNWYGGKDFYAKYFSTKFLNTLKDEFQKALEEQEKKEAEKKKKESGSVI